jgi:hypothetical protein
MHRLLLQLALAFVAVLSLSLSPALADAPLASALGLDVEQARQVDVLQAGHRKAFAAARQDFNRESRALRRARIAHDAAETARLEQRVEAMRVEITLMRQAHDDEIRKLLRPDQSQRFDAHLDERRQMRGSSRDEWIF